MSGIDRRLQRVGVILPLLLLAAGPAAGAESHGAHEHGRAELNLVLEGRELVVEFTSPAANMVGFEHQPRTVKQKQALKEALARLRQGDKMVILPAAAQCALERAEVSSDLEGRAAQAGEHGHAPGHAQEHGHAHAEHGEHADFSAIWHFQCQTPDQLGSLELRPLFKAFPATKRVRAQAVTPRGQFGGELSPGRPKLAL